MNPPRHSQEPQRVVETFKPPPASSCFPEHPASWYLFCHENELRKGPSAKRILDRDLVAFQTASGKVAVLDARCSHLGANLGRGEVIGEALQCPFHNWRFGCDGHCEEIPGSAHIPSFARQKCYPVVRRHGFVFFFNGVEPLFPLPFFQSEPVDDFAAARSFSYTAQAEWFMVAAQGFDRQHFEAVHDRRLLEPPQADCPTPFVRRNRWRAEIIGESIRDRILRTLVGKTVDLTIHNWGGTLFVVKAEFPRACSRFIVFFRPLQGQRTHFDVIVFARRGLPALGLAGRRWFTRGHLLAEADMIQNTQYRPARFIDADADMIACFHWLAALPQQFPAAEATNYAINGVKFTNGKDLKVDC
jgi:phenylpropionate dioxygenase-like ring-hydroxylating dioxygenase large terminal subunit